MIPLSKQCPKERITTLATWVGVAICTLLWGWVFSITFFPSWPDYLKAKSPGERAIELQVKHLLADPFFHFIKHWCYTRSSWAAPLSPEHGLDFEIPTSSFLRKKQAVWRQPERFALFHQYLTWTAEVEGRPPPPLDRDLVTRWLQFGRIFYAGPEPFSKRCPDPMDYGYQYEIEGYVEEFYDFDKIKRFLYHATGPVGFDGIAYNSP